MPRTFESPSSYQPSASLLGRAIRAWADDRLRGEALYIVVLTGLTLLVLMAHYLGWALLKPLLTAHPSWQLWFWGGQVASLVLLGGLGLVGVRPAVRVTCSSGAITLEQGDTSRTIPYDGVEEVKEISARRFHRHERRYAAVTVFLSTVPDRLLLLRTRQGPVVVGLPDPDDHAALREHLATAHSSPAGPVPQPQS